MTSRHQNSYHSKDIISISSDEDDEDFSSTRPAERPMQHVLYPIDRPIFGGRPPRPPSDYQRHNERYPSHQMPGPARPYHMPSQSMPQPPPQPNEHYQQRNNTSMTPLHSNQYRFLPQPQRADTVQSFPQVIENSSMNDLRHRSLDLPPLRKSEQLLRQVISRRACTFCIELNEANSCDGGNPCSACFEPNPDKCEYPGEIKPNSRISNSSKRLNAKGSKLGSRSAGVPRHDDDQPVPLLFPEYDVSFCDQESVKSLLKRFEQQKNIHREYVLQGELMQAKLSCQQSVQPLQKTSKMNPFAKLIKKAKQRAEDANQNHSHSTTQIMVKTHRGNGPKKFSQTRIAVTYFETDESAPVLPKYKSIGRLGTSFLTRNVHTLKYMPYSAEDEAVSAAQDEKEKELKQRYKSDDEELIKQRKCQEMIYLWKPWMNEMFRTIEVSTVDIIQYVASDIFARCRLCAICPAHDNWRQAALYMPKTDSIATGKFDRVRWLAEAFLELTSQGLWHLIVDKEEVKVMMNKAKGDKNSFEKSAMCSICFLHDCPSHGTYRDSNDNNKRKVRINDPETENNTREWTNLKRRSGDDKHQCGFYCIPGKQLRDFSLPDLYGMDIRSKVVGLRNPNLLPSVSGKFADNILCSTHCFWSIEKRRMFHLKHPELKNAENISETETKLLRKYVSLFGHHHRAPCMISKSMKLPCMAVFYKLIAIVYSPPHRPEGTIDELGERPPIGGRKISRLAAGYDTSRSHKLDMRKPYVPCDHSGSCLDDYDCSCAGEDVYCEWFCGCDDSCKRRFQGCKCRGRRCFNDDRCECWANNRECDPWLCGSCGVMEVLDPNNKNEEEIRNGRCQNNRIQLDLPARTIKAPSEVQGWGLYAGQDLDVNTFIGEYKGEVISTKEGDRRGVVYHNIGQEYLFITNSEQQIDGSNFGNKTRFMNNSQLEKNINVLAKNLLSNGVQRVMFYTKRSVKAGEELLYNYNYPDHVVKYFWERGEKPASKHGVPAPVAKPRIDGRLVKSVIRKQDGQESPARKQEQVREKRKRLSDEDEDETLPNNGIPRPTTGTFANESDESDYEGPDEFISEGSETEESFISSSEDDVEARLSDRKRPVQSNDRQRSGKTQQRSWETRKR